MFPKFSAVEVENAGKSRMNMSVINANLTNAFNRLEGRLHEEQLMTKRQEEEIRARQLLTQQLFLERKSMELAKQKELNRFLTQQKEEAEQRRFVTLVTCFSLLPSYLVALIFYLVACLFSYFVNVLLVHQGHRCIIYNHNHDHDNEIQ